MLLLWISTRSSASSDEQGTVWRQRVGRDYRVLFRMNDEELEVLDVVHRQDLERTVRLLK